MKIAFVYDAVYPWIKGGAEKRIYELGKRLAKENEVHVFGVKWWEGDDTIKYEGMVLHGVCKPMELYVEGRRSIPEAMMFSIKLFPHLVREKFDIIDVSAFPYFSCFAAKLVSIFRRTPMIITWHEVWGDYWYEYLGAKGFFGRLVEYLATRLTSKMIAVSALTSESLMLLGVHGQNINIIPNGIDLKRIADITPSSEESDVIFAGRLIKEKNLDLLLRALSEVKNTMPGIKCHIIGEGPEKERLVKLAFERGLESSVSFREFMEYDEVITRIKSSKLFVLPSSREGFGIVVIEAFACGVPVITVKNQGNAACELVSESTGFVVNLDAKELANAILTLLTDTAFRTRMASCARHSAKEYDWEKVARKLNLLYEILINPAISLGFR